MPSKLTKGQTLISILIDARIRALVRTKEKMYHKARRSNDDSLKSRYERLRAYVQKGTRVVYWRYVSYICIPSETDTKIEGCNRNDRPKRFLSFMKNLRRDSSGVSCLRENGILKTGNKDKSDIFSRQFVYTRENACDISLKGPSPYQI